MVSEALAEHAWPGQDAIGKRLKIPQLDTPYHEAWLAVVGVVGNVRYRELQATRLDLYMSHLQADHRSGKPAWSERAPNPTTVAAAVRDVVWNFDRDKAPPTVSVMTGVVSEALAGPRFTTAIFGAFALVALVLSALGLYGLLAYSTARRTREIGVRVALGARPGDVGRLVLREGLQLTVTGIACGLAVAWATTRLLQNLLYGVKSTDGVSIAAAVGVLLAVALLACGPARASRAARRPGRGAARRIADRLARSLRGLETDRHERTGRAARLVGPGRRATRAEAQHVDEAVLVDERRGRRQRRLGRRARRERCRGARAAEPHGRRRRPTDRRRSGPGRTSSAPAPRRKTSAEAPARSQKPSSPSRSSFPYVPSSGKYR